MSREQLHNSTATIAAAASRRRRASALSLKNIHSKLTDLDYSTSEEDLSSKPKAPFSQLTLIEKWSSFGTTLQSEGELSMASIINSNTPTLKDNQIVFALPSKLMEDQFAGIRSKLLNYLRSELNNYGIVVNTVVVQEESKKYIYTPQEKFQKLVESNPDVLLLKTTFGLDI